MSPELPLSIIYDNSTKSFNIQVIDSSGNRVYFRLTEEAFRNLIFDLNTYMYSNNLLFDFGSNKKDTRGTVVDNDTLLNLFNPGPQLESEVNIYIKDRLTLHEQEELVNACGEFMEGLGFELKAEEEPIYNSLWKRLQFVMKRNITEEDIDRTFRKGKQALELKYVDLPSAEQTEKLASAAEKIAGILKSVDNGAIQLGSLIALKRTIDGIPNLRIQQLTSDQVYYLNTNPEAIKDFENLERMIFGARVQVLRSTLENIENHAAQIKIDRSSEPLPDIDQSTTEIPEV